jgi:hypothetical protein
MPDTDELYRHIRVLEDQLACEREWLDYRFNEIGAPLVHAVETLELISDAMKEIVTTLRYMDEAQRAMALKLSLWRPRPVEEQ